MTACMICVLGEKCQSGPHPGLRTPPGPSPAEQPFGTGDKASVPSVPQAPPSFLFTTPMLSARCLIWLSHTHDPLRRKHIILVILLGAGFRQMEIKLPLKIKDTQN